MTLKSLSLHHISEYRRLAGIDQIGRRYVALNAFDGILTIMGVLMGCYVAGIRQPYIVFSTAAATCIAMTVSGFWGAYMTESAERKADMQELGQAMLRDMDDTSQARASRFAVLAIALINGLSPLLAVLLVIAPFLLTHLWADILVSYVLALALALSILFCLGVFLARVARESIVRSGVRMLLAGVVCVVLAFVLSSGAAA